MLSLSSSSYFICQKRRRATRKAEAHHTLVAHYVRRHLLDKQLWDASVCFLVQDGHGHGQLVGLCLLAGEDSSQMRVILEMFANANPNIAQMHWQVPKQKKKKKVQCLQQ